MTWLSRLLPQSHDSQRAIDRHRNRRIRQGRRRRVSALEPLEGRIVLSTISVNQDMGTGVVTINGDSAGDYFKVTLNSNDTLSVVGTPSPNTPLPGSSIKTQVNNYSPGFAWTSTLPATGLNMNLPGTTGVADNVLLTNALLYPPTHISQLNFINTNVLGTESLTLNATGIRLHPGPGSFTITDGTLTTPGGQLTANISGSLMGSMSIFQTGCCPANVSLTGDIVAGPVSVTEGAADGDSISLVGDYLGPTTLTQYVGPTTGPTPGTCHGKGDTISVNASTLNNLTATQLGDGGGQNIYVGTFGPNGPYTVVKVLNNSTGVIASQPNAGGGDTIEIVSVCALGMPTNTVTSAGGPAGISATQGNGNGEHIYVDSSLVYGNITAVQGNGGADIAQFTGDSAGWQYTNGPVITDPFGIATISQGDGNNDQAILGCGLWELPGAPNSFNNVVIQQGNGSLVTTGCDPTWGDLVMVDCTNVTSNMTIVQGYNDTSSDLGYNYVAIATQEPVTVGNATVINEVGTNNGHNQIYLGGAGSMFPNWDFSTGYLDVYTGDAGGSYVQVVSTQVLYGTLPGYPTTNITGGGGNNTSSIDFWSQFFGGVTSQF